jgi:hypothetical protein
MKQVKLTEVTDHLLELIKKKRKDAGELINTKQDIVADLIIRAHKKECAK